ncbi:MAG: hypothetical protein L6Q80_08830 [Dehalococcoidia bacterium]|nr:MAG: hypothetical protein EDM76_07485 [bacterium]MCK6564841.1 hypothetical protein [Dehalococcoidia bacterium]MCL4230612.1 hypothetical protein [Dehalococcoidia bacterium]RIL02524.1 MAG: hypothetical protein DCC78_07600 [bacterium]
MRLPVLLALVLAGLVALPIHGAPSARANGVPQLVKLTYLEGISNFGPREAEGVLEFSFAEAYARVDVKNLPPQANVHYEGWMLGPGGKSLYVADLVVNDSGVGSFEAKLTNLDGYDYDMFVVAARTGGSPGVEVPSQKSIAGKFVLLTNNESAKPGDIRPELLPDTGEEPAAGIGERLGFTVLVMAIVACCALAAIRLHRQRVKS